jgi:hypothetical protein
MKTTQGSAHIPSAPLPQVHLNGTSQPELLQGYHYAYRALETFRHSFAESTCNPRDYYVQDDSEAYSKARASRDAVLSLVQEIEQYLADHIYHLSE